MREHADAPAEILRKVRAICLALPQVYEETAWVGTRWRSRSKTIAHVVPVEENWPPAYVRATESVATGAPLVVMTFRAHEAEHAAFRAVGYPYFVPVWWPDIVGVVLDSSTDWTEISELVGESYRLLAPKKLSVLL